MLTLSNGEVHRYVIPLTLTWEDEDEGSVSALLHVMLAKVRQTVFSSSADAANGMLGPWSAIWTQKIQEENA